MGREDSSSRIAQRTSHIYRIELNNLGDACDPHQADRKDIDGPFLPYVFGQVGWKWKIEICWVVFGREYVIEIQNCFNKCLLQIE